MLIFVDESGDNGFKFGEGSSRYFLVTTVHIKKDNASSVAACIEASRIAVNWKREFHFKENPDTVRARFLDNVRKEEFYYRAILIDKQKVSSYFPRKKAEFYKAVVELLFRDDPQHFHNSKIFVDETSDQEFQNQLKKHLRSIAAECDVSILDIKFKNWKQNSLLQVADMISGAIYRKYDRGHVIFYDRIKKREHKILIIDQ
ncbi:MAG: DUF3800 domain-containing protein [Tumebacillaceae bacterium]